MSPRATTSVQSGRTYITIVTKARACVLFLSLNRFCFFTSFHSIQRFYDRRVLIPIGQNRIAAISSPCQLSSGTHYKSCQELSFESALARTRVHSFTRQWPPLLLYYTWCVIQFARRRRAVVFSRATRPRHYYTLVYCFDRDNSRRVDVMPITNCNVCANRSVYVQRARNY